MWISQAGFFLIVPVTKFDANFFGFCNVENFDATRTYAETMAAAEPQHWYERLIPASLRGVFARSNEDVTLSAGELEAEAIDDNDLRGSYAMDEREIHIFVGLHYSADQQAWLASQLCHTARRHTRKLLMEKRLLQCDVRRASL